MVFLASTKGVEMGGKSNNKPLVTYLPPGHAWGYGDRGWLSDLSITPTSGDLKPCGYIPRNIGSKSIYKHDPIYGNIMRQEK